MESRIVKTYIAQSKGDELIISVPSEKWVTKMRDADAAGFAAEFIRKNGILCDINVINGFLMDC